MTNIFQILFCFQIQSAFFQSAFYKVYLAFRVYLSVFDVFLLLHCYRHQKSGWSMVSWKVGWSSWQKGMSRLLGSFHLSSFYFPGYNFISLSVFSLFLKDFQDVLLFQFIFERLPRFTLIWMAISIHVFPHTSQYSILSVNLWFPYFSLKPVSKEMVDERPVKLQGSTRWKACSVTSLKNEMGKACIVISPSPENRLLWTLKQIGLNLELISLP